MSSPDQPSNTEPSASAAGRVLKPLYLTGPSHSQANHHHHTPTRTRRAPSLNLFSQSHLSYNTPPSSLSHSVSSSINSGPFTPSLSSSQRSSTFNSRRARACSVSVALARPFTDQDPQFPLPRSMSLTYSLQCPSPPAIYHRQNSNTNTRHSKTPSNQFRSLIPYSKSNSIFIPPTHPHSSHQHPDSNNNPFCQSPSDAPSHSLDSEIDSLLASMIDCAKSFGIQDELNGIVDI